MKMIIMSFSLISHTWKLYCLSAAHIGHHGGGGCFVRIGHGCIAKGLSCSEFQSALLSLNPHSWFVGYLHCLRKQTFAKFCSSL